MAIIKTEKGIWESEGIGLGSVVSVQAVAFHCRGKREKRREEGGSNKYFKI